MDWRKTIEHQKPTSTPRALDPKAVRESFARSPEYRAAQGHPDLYQLALRANAYKERLRRGL